MSARLIAIEGSDGAGKETQTDKLYTLLTGRGMRVARVSFPRYKDTIGGKLLYEVLKGDRRHNYAFSKADPYVASKLYAMDREESKPFLKSLQEENDVVIFDRYVESNLLHQGGKFKTDAERRRFAEWLFRFEYNDIGLPRPHEIVYLSIPFWLSRKRADERAKAAGSQLDAVEEDIEYVKNGHEGGQFYAREFGWMKVEGLVDGRELTKEEVHQRLVAAVGYAGNEYVHSVP